MTPTLTPIEAYKFLGPNNHNSYDTDEFEYLFMDFPLTNDNKMVAACEYDNDEFFYMSNIDDISPTWVITYYDE